MDKKRLIILLAAIIVVVATSSVVVVTILVPDKPEATVVEAESDLAQSLLSSFKGGLVAYVDMNQVQPQYFSDFVVLDTLDPYPQTITLIDVKDQLKRPAKSDDLKVKELVVEFKSGVKVKYTLKGDNILFEKK